MKKLIIAVASICALAGVARAGTPVYGELISSGTQTVSFTKDFDMTDMERFSIQAVYSNGTPASHSVTDGRKSTATITVAATPLASVIAKVAASSITVVNNATTSGVVITINGETFTEGVQWTKGAVASNTAVSLATAIDGNLSLNSTSNAPGAVVFASAAVYGITPNSWAITSSLPTAVYVQAPTFAGGQDSATVTINNITLLNGTDFTAVATASGTAKAISDAIMANTSLSTIIVSTWQVGPTSTGIVFATATTTGINAYSITTSTRPILTPSDSIFAGGSDSSVSPANDTVTKSSHNFTTGLQVLVSTPGSGTMPTGLVSGTTYYVIRDSSVTYKFATSSANATAGTAVDITSTTGNTSMTVAPLAFSASTDNGFAWQGSNDTTNFANLAISSVTYSAAGTTLWDFGNYNYRVLRINFKGPTSGGINLVVIMNGKKAGPD